MWLDNAEKWLRRADVIAMLGFLAMLLAGLRQAEQQRKGRTAGQPLSQLQWGSPLFIPLSAAGFGLLYLLWRPLRLSLPTPLRAAALFVGAPLYFFGMALMFWGRLTLGKMYNVSSSLGAQLYADHQLITSGPFAIVRHPMYLGGQLAEIGALLLYRNWTTLLTLLNVPVLVLRARREEQALAAEFGEQWTAYRRGVPFWIPRLPR